MILEPLSTIKGLIRTFYVLASKETAIISKKPLDTPPYRMPKRPLRNRKVNLREKRSLNGDLHATER